MAQHMDEGKRIGAHGAPSHSSTERSSGSRFATSGRPPATTSGSESHARAGAHAAPAHRAPAQATRSQKGVQPAYRRMRDDGPKRPPVVPIVVAAIALIAIIVVIVRFAVPAVSNLVSGETGSVEAGLEARINIPEGASGDQIAQILSEAHVIEDPKEYYAAVRQLHADNQIKPGDYLFMTHQDPVSVVQTLSTGPNIRGISLTVPEGLTVDQTAQAVEEAYGIPAADFIAQAKASNYAGDYPFLEGAYNDSLEGYLYPKTYSFTSNPTVDDLIRAMLDQFLIETEGLDLSSAPDGLSSQQVIALASLIERESRVEDERPVIAGVIYNRLDADMPLQIDAAIVYARGGGSQEVTYDDLEIDSPYNVYKNTGLTPGPICSPSISSIEAALAPQESDYLYYVLSADGDGRHVFSVSYDEFLANRDAYLESQS